MSLAPLGSAMENEELPLKGVTLPSLINAEAS
jgi:hypothetical protein